MNRIILFLINIFLINHVSISQSSIESQIDDLGGRLQETGNPGMSIGIIEKGEIIFSRGYGLANLEHQIPFTSSTVSDLGSVSKQLTAFAIIMLHDKGRLSLDDNIRTYLKELPDLGHVVTIRHLIHHTSGIPDIYSLHSLKGLRPGDHVSQSDAIRFIKRRPNVDYVPGERYRYSNTAYMFLAEIISKVTGQKFELWMQENIFEPLGMDHTGIMDVQGEIFPNMADGYIKREDNTYIKIYDNSTLQGGGGVYSTGEDMLKWIDNFRTRKLGNENIFSIFLHTATLNDKTKIDYAGGINVNKYRGIKRYTHNGSSAGYRTKMAYYPDYELGFIVKSNTPEIGYKQFDKIEDIILESIIGPSLLPKKEVINDGIKEIETNISFISEDYDGNYFSEALDFSMEVEKKNGAIILKNFFYDFPPLSPVGIDLFKQGGNEVQFIRNDSNIIVSLSITTPRASKLLFYRKMP